MQSAVSETGKAHGKKRAATLGDARADGAALRGHQSLDDGQAQARAFPAALSWGLDKALERMGLDLGGKAGPRIAHFQDHP